MQRPNCPPSAQASPCSPRCHHVPSSPSRPGLLVAPGPVQPGDISGGSRLATWVARASSAPAPDPHPGCWRVGGRLALPWWGRSAPGCWHHASPGPWEPLRLSPSLAVLPMPGQGAPHSDSSPLGTRSPVPTHQSPARPPRLSSHGTNWAPGQKGGLRGAGTTVGSGCSAWRGCPARTGGWAVEPLPQPSVGTARVAPRARPFSKGEVQPALTQGALTQ